MRVNIKESTSRWPRRSRDKKHTGLTLSDNNYYNRGATYSTRSSGLSSRNTRGTRCTTRQREYRWTRWQFSRRISTHTSTDSLVYRSATSSSWRLPSERCPAGRSVAIPPERGSPSSQIYSESFFLLYWKNKVFWLSDEVRLWLGCYGLDIFSQVIVMEFMSSSFMKEARFCLDITLQYDMWHLHDHFTCTLTWSFIPGLLINDVINIWSRHQWRAGYMYSVVSGLLCSWESIFERVSEASDFSDDLCCHGIYRGQT